MNSTITSLCSFFEYEVPNLPATYTWKIPAINEFSEAGQSGYAPNIKLKEFLNQRWLSAVSAEEQLAIAKIIVSDWGGVRGNRPETLTHYVAAITQAIPETPLKGVASYSKIFSIVHPERFAIYDARVAACLNAVQLNAHISEGLAFNYVPGRNNIIGNSITKRGFTQDPRFSRKELLKRGWSEIKKDHTYSVYLNLLNSCLKELKEFKLVELEMALFANAETQCAQAMKAY